MEDVLKYTKGVIQISYREIKKEKSCPPEKMKEFKELVKIYSILYAQAKSGIADSIANGNGDPSYYDRMVAECHNKMKPSTH